LAFASAARPARCTNTGAHDVLNSISLATQAPSRRQNEPAETPAGHEEALREAVDDDQAIVGGGDVEEAGRSRPGFWFADDVARRTCG
jgi:hypothetical protein